MVEVVMIVLIVIHTVATPLSIILMMKYSDKIREHSNRNKGGQ